MAEPASHSAQQAGAPPSSARQAPPTRLHRGASRTVPEVIAAVCPFLVAADGAWRAAVPTREHRCGATDPPGRLPIDRQQTLCLTAAHLDCPLFEAAAGLTVGPHLQEAAKAAAELDPRAVLATVADARPGQDGEPADAPAFVQSHRPIPRTTPVILDRARPPMDVHLPQLRLPSLPFRRPSAAEGRPGSDAVAPQTRIAELREKRERARDAREANGPTAAGAAAGFGDGLAEHEIAARTDDTGSRGAFRERAVASPAPSLNRRPVERDEPIARAGAIPGWPTSTPHNAADDGGSHSMADRFGSGRGARTDAVDAPRAYHPGIDPDDFEASGADGSKARPGTGRFGIRSHPGSCMEPDDELSAAATPVPPARRPSTLMSRRFTPPGGPGGFRTLGRVGGSGGGGMAGVRTAMAGREIQAALAALLGLALVLVLVVKFSGGSTAVVAGASSSPRTSGAATARPSGAAASAAASAAGSGAAATAKPTAKATAKPTAKPATPTAIPAKSAATATRTYRVKPGDTLSGIAGTYHTTVATLMRLNSLTDPRLLRVGQVLKLP